MTPAIFTNRRSVLAGLATTAALPSVALAAELRPLKALADEKGILFGAALGAGKPGSLTGSHADRIVRDLIKAECSVIVPENELKIYVIGAQRDQYDFAPGDSLVRFATENDLKVRGHTLFWNRLEFLPKWLLSYDFGPTPIFEAERFLRDYIERVCTHYGPRISSWDVVNETIDPRTGNVRNTPFTRILGFDALRIAYEATREYAPHAQLVYNDYMSWGAGNERHRAGVLKLLEAFRKQNVPVDALGLQSHLGNDGGIDPDQKKQWQAFVDEAAGMGYKLLITEFDVNDKNISGDIKRRDSEIAAIAKDYLDLMLSYTQLDHLLCWGLVDRYSWLQGGSPRGDGLPLRPLPFDNEGRAKPLREAIAAALRGAPTRNGLSSISGLSRDGREPLDRNDSC